MPVQLIRKVRDRQPNRIVRLSYLPPNRWVALFNFFCGASPKNLIQKKDEAWTHVGTKPTPKACASGVGVSNGAASGSYSSFGPYRHFDGFSPANSPAFFVFSFIGASYVSNGSSANVIWSYGSIDSGNGFYCAINSSSQLFILLANTQLNGPVLTPGKIYNCVAGRNSSGDCWLFINGQFITSGSGAVAADSSVARVLTIIGDETGNRAFAGTILLFGMGSDNPYHFGRQLSENPWQIFEPETIPLFYSTVTAQYARPTSDVSTGTWTASSGSDLFAMLDETTASDADYIVTTGASTCEVALSGLNDPAVSTGHIVRYRISSTTGGITVRLRQGTTTIASWTHNPAPTSLTTYSQTLSAGEADSITNYGALKLQFEAI